MSDCIYPRPSGGLQSENSYAKRGRDPSVSCSVTDRSPSRRRQTITPVRSKITIILRLLDSPVKTDAFPTQEEPDESRHVGH